MEASPKAQAQYTGRTRNGPFISIYISQIDADLCLFKVTAAEVSTGSRLGAAVVGEIPGPVPTHVPVALGVSLFN